MIKRTHKRFLFLLGTVLTSFVPFLTQHSGPSYQENVSLFIDIARADVPFTAGDAGDAGAGDAGCSGASGCSGSGACGSDSSGCASDSE